MTEWHIEATPDLLAWLDRIPPKIRAQLPVAVFDTRYRISNRFSGSAAHAISKEMEIQGRGGLLVAPPKSFFVADREGPFEAGEVERSPLSPTPSLSPRRAREVYSPSTHRGKGPRIGR